MGVSHEVLAPSAWVIRWAGLVAEEATVLDLACGYGRHARFLAERGHDVLAVDRDEAALASMAGVRGITALQADLENAPWPLAGRTFGAVVVTNYLWRPLIPTLIAALAPGGLLIYETFMRGNERYGRPSNPEFLLRPGELLEAVGGRLEVLGFEQGVVESPESPSGSASGGAWLSRVLKKGAMPPFRSPEHKAVESEGSAETARKTSARDEFQQPVSGARGDVSPRIVRSTKPAVVQRICAVRGDATALRLP